MPRSGFGIDCFLPEENSEESRGSTSNPVPVAFIQDTRASLKRRRSPPAHQKGKKNPVSTYHRFFWPTPAPVTYPPPSPQAPLPERETKFACPNTTIHCYHRRVESDIAAVSFDTETWTACPRKHCSLGGSGLSGKNCCLGNVGFQFRKVAMLGIQGNGSWEI